MYDHGLWHIKITFQHMCMVIMFWPEQYVCVTTQCANDTVLMQFAVLLLSFSQILNVLGHKFPVGH